jgi:enamine deaminase RidA (YjgF/YER057c/UK114 family)
MSIARLDAGNGLFSLGVSYNGVVTTAGVVADDLSQDAKGQATQILAKLDQILAHFGTSKAKLLTANLWVSDIRYRGLVNEAWVAWIDKSALPTRATVEAALAEPNMLVEIQVTAAA